MIIDRWKSYGRRTNKQKRKENKEWWKIIIIIIIKNNIIIMKKEKSKLSVSIQFAFTLTVYTCLHGLLEPVCCFDLGMDFVK